LDVIEVKLESVTPGYVNSVRAGLDPFPAVSINEVLASNATGLTDAAGDRDPWVELANTGTSAASLAGCYLANSFTNLTQWAFPAAASLPAGRLQVVWADAEPQESTALEWHTNFRLSSPAGVVVMSRLQNGQPAIVDYLTYSGASTDKSYGYADPRTFDAVPVLLAKPTPGTPNLDSPSSAPQITGVVMGDDDRFTMLWTSVPGRRYQLLAKDSLDDPTWLVVGEVSADGPETGLTDAGAVGKPHRFYRVLLVP
jgi:hypothetical protein